MLFKGTLIGEASGSIAGVTFSHNRGGQYTRVRRVPTNPNSPRQSTVRGRFATLSQSWRDLTPAQRAAWADVAPTVSLTNALGESIQYTGQQLYVAVNSVRLDAGLTVLSAAPSAAGRADNTVTAVDANDGGDTIEVTFGAGDWTQAGGALLVQLGGPVSPGVSFFNGPFRQTGVILGAASPPASGSTVTAPADFSLAFNYWCRLRTTDQFGRISEPLILPVTLAE
jgi:hypothetical protein